MEQILVTGASGFIGSRLIASLKDKYHITALVRAGSKTQAIKDMCKLYVYDNVDDFIDFLKQEKFIGVIHLAALYIKNHHSRNVEDIIGSNVIFGTQICDALVRVGFSGWFINVGSFWQFYKNMPDNPLDLYASSKNAFLKIIDFYANTTKINFATMYLNDTYGTNDTRPKIWNLWKKIAKSQESIEMSGGEQIIDLVHIDDIVNAFSILINLLNSPFASLVKHQKFTLHSKDKKNLKELSKIFEKVSGKKLNIHWGAKPYEPRENFIPFEGGDPLPQWEAKIDIEEGFKQLWEAKEDETFCLSSATINPADITTKESKMPNQDENNEIEQTRTEIFAGVKRYYELVHKKKTFFKVGDKINYAGRIFDEKEMLSLVDSALSFWLTASKYANEFEQKFAKFLGVSHALLVNSGSSANLLAFATLTSALLKDRAIQKGDEVITLAAGFPTTIAPIIQCGAIPVFVDIELATGNIDISCLDKAISKKTKAIFIAHTLGNPFNLKIIKEFCDTHSLWLIEDNCDALGATYEGKFTGTFGDIGTSSFYPAHHITMGEGGAVYTNNASLKKIAQSIRDWGRDCWCEGGKDNTCKNRFNKQYKNLPFGYDHKYVYSHFGYNLKATEMQASIGLAQLEKLEYFVEKRRKNHTLLTNLLQDCNDIFHLPKIEKNANPSWFGFLLIIKDGIEISRNQIVEFLESKNIQTRNLFGGNMLLQPVFESLKNGVDYKIIGDLKNTNKVMRDGFWVGVYPGLNEEAISYIAQNIKLALKEIKGGGGIVDKPSRKEICFTFFTKPLKLAKTTTFLHSISQTTYTKVA